MSLFGAASSGVDPKTGSYLNKEQRIAMFQASRGNGGDGAGGAAGGGRRVANPKTAIVVANKMTSVVQKLQTSYQSSTQAVSEQTQANKTSLENLANTVAQNRENILTDEKRETRNDRLEKENRLRGAKENLIEGLSAAAAGIVGAGQKAADKVVRPVRGLLERILRAFGALAAAWAIDNLPTLLEAWEDFTNGLPDFRSATIDSLKNMRGVWSIIDIGLRKILPGVRRVAKTLGRTVRFVARKTAQISSKIFSAVKTFVVKIASKMIGAIVDLGKAAKNAIGNGLRSLTGGANDAARAADATSDAARSGSKALDAAGDAKPKGFFGRALDSIRGGLGKTKDMFDAGVTKLRSMGGSIKDGLTNLGGPKKDGPMTGKQKGFMKGLLDKVLGIAEKDKSLPPPRLKALRGMLGKAESLFRRLPGVGFAIDYALNNAQGVEWQENLARSLASSLLGMVGATKGALVGAGLGATAGTVVMPIAGTAVGGAIGGALGAILGGMLMGTIGDGAAALAYSAVTGKDSTDTGIVGGDLFNQGADLLLGRDGEPSAKAKLEGSATTSDAELTVQVSPSSSAVVTAGSMSTPEGLNMPGSSSGGNVKVTTTELPTQDLRSEPEAQSDTNVQQSEVMQTPNIPSFNPETSLYREMSASYFDLFAF